MDGRFRVLLWYRSRHHRKHLAYHRSKDETRASVEGIADLLLRNSVTRVYSSDLSDQWYVEVPSAKASLRGSSTLCLAARSSIGNLAVSSTYSADLSTADQDLG